MWRDRLVHLFWIKSTENLLKASDTTLLTKHRVKRIEYQREVLSKTHDIYNVFINSWQLHCLIKIRCGVGTLNFFYHRSQTVAGLLDCGYIEPRTRFSWWYYKLKRKRWLAQDLKMIFIDSFYYSIMWFKLNSIHLGFVWNLL